jgi:hypothetical protein
MESNLGFAHAGGTGVDKQTCRPTCDTGSPALLAELPANRSSSTMPSGNANPQEGYSSAACISTALLVAPAQPRVLAVRATLRAGSALEPVPTVRERLVAR